MDRNRIRCCVGALLLTVAGCDAYYRSHQMVDVQLTVSDSLQPIAGATLTAAPEAYRPEGTSQEQYVQRADQAGVNTARTDAEGLAHLRINTSTIVGGLFNRKKPYQDVVTGRLFIVRVVTPVRTHWLTLNMVEGRSAFVNGMRLVVTSIGKPTPDEEPR